MAGTFPAGAIGVLVMTTANSLIAGRWDHDYVRDFLLLKENGVWLCRISAALLYIFMVFGMSSLLGLAVKLLLRRINHKRR